jgi:hypothetical protein
MYLASRNLIEEETRYFYPNPAIFLSLCGHAGSGRRNDHLAGNCAVPSHPRLLMVIPFKIRVPAQDSLPLIGEGTDSPADLG